MQVGEVRIWGEKLSWEGDVQCISLAVPEHPTRVKLEEPQQGKVDQRLPLMGKYAVSLPEKETAN